MSVACLKNFLFGRAPVSLYNNGEYVLEYEYLRRQKKRKPIAQHKSAPQKQRFKLGLFQLYNKTYDVPCRTTSFVQNESLLPERYL